MITPTKRLSERLRARAAVAESESRFGDAEDMREAADAIDAKDAEIERLRAALESLTEDPPSTLDEPDEDYEVIIKMRAIARAALDAKPVKP